MTAKVYVYGLDMDGSLLHKDDGGAGVIANNSNLIQLIQQYADEKDVERVVISFSNRQTHSLECTNAAINRNGNSTQALTTLKEHCRVSLNKLLLGDVYLDQPVGTTFDWIAQEAGHVDDDASEDKQESRIEGLRTKTDTSKAALLYAHAHYLKSLYPDAEVVYTVVDDQEDILNGLIALYERYPNLLPAGFSVWFRHYAGQTVTPMGGLIVGTGELDQAWEGTIKNRVTGPGEVAGHDLKSARIKDSAENLSEKVVGLAEQRLHVGKQAAHLQPGVSTPLLGYREREEARCSSCCPSCVML